ncbi:orotidine-5'-phosphate decarboxylase [Salinivibrio sp. EAGSL]|uniref:orotidine-5'-phosphate decarboxylase n=1 Tax=Salinivibrio sp. EAGSL TaxID=2738468 RepID=UPI00158D87F7|nr:orotidine-5'-phosphate decarboxylase [Salinivibrio sp. EAGSL]NUY55581.1 orotidine-5'-phosphate decarboxylase [Salinivibrio sp. EAGSL]
MHDPKVIVALDYADMNQALSFADKIEPGSCRLKVGKEMFTLFGPVLVKQLHAGGHDVFLDLKFHDIPNTCARAVAAAAELGVWMVNVHASGGERMMSAAREALEPYGGNRPLLIGVTVLTSMTDADLRQIGVQRSPQAQVQHLAKLTQQSGLDGVVCSAQEASLLKAQCGDTFKLVTPGIRPAGSAAGDQRRIMTPEEAVNAGSNYLVIGRPVTQAADPAAVLHTINQSLRT